MAQFVGRRMLRVFKQEVVLSPVLTLELARTPREWANGLMYRRFIPLHTGMLFMMGKAGRHGIWMRNTPLWLDVAWLDRDGTVLEMRTLNPLDETTRYPTREAYYVLEMGQGSFVSYGAREGDQLRVFDRTGNRKPLQVR